MFRRNQQQIDGRCSDCYRWLVRIAILGSGSKGNCVVVDGGGSTILIDVGFGPKEVRRRMQHLGMDLADIDAIIITHAHGDHVKGARQLAAAMGKPTWATEATRRFASTFTCLKNHVEVTPGQRFKIGGLSILPIKTSHDDPGSVAYAIDDGDEAFAFCTDLGDPHDNVAAGLRGVDSLMLEFNHDRHMLQTGPYSSHLKRRVASRHGHLNNDDSALLLSKAVTSSLTRVLCAHLSEVNNTNHKALEAARSVVDGKDIDIAVAPQHAPTEWLRVRRLATTASTTASTRATAPPPPPPTGPVTMVKSDVSDVIDAVIVESPPPALSASTHLALRAVVRQRQLALFAAVAPSPATTSTTSSPRHSPTKERRR